METRSATKQQELEQQIGTLTTLMRELKAGQAGQARRQEEQQTNELRTSIQRQEQQLTRLADDHESRLKVLTTGQMEAAETCVPREELHLNHICYARPFGSCGGQIGYTTRGAGF